jgi:hypothetical protein
LIVIPAIYGLVKEFGVRKESAKAAPKARGAVHTAGDEPERRDGAR